MDYQTYFLHFLFMGFKDISNFHVILKISILINFLLLIIITLVFSLGPPLTGILLLKLFDSLALDVSRLTILKNPKILTKKLKIFRIIYFLFW